MLGAAVTPNLELGGRFLKDLAVKQLREEYFEPTKVSVFFGEADVTVPDPFFKDKGPKEPVVMVVGAA